MTDEVAPDLETRLQGYVAQIEALARDESIGHSEPEVRKRMRALMRSIPEEDVEAFSILVDLKVMRYVEKVEQGLDMLQCEREEHEGEAAPVPDENGER